ncbi:hypothetical protein DOM22_09370 [Bdellovibrio sp. ZAP7]|uniref:WavE lipopolysaccharide synthesis family protein n=1 Tax=Bdellovibrio sp. ZAP7 TaxID=2231053 RepID=UPI0011588A84|nr:WavE lipopolysaccharide synthesis family protein [Bdellovibrio sp. ZAP7]QDK45346.1 hypothetical protein DOM22_09370 [Bdellovibrio sp. ZAP7]
MNTNYDCTLLIAGPWHANTMKMIEKNADHFKHIIVSTWSNAAPSVNLPNVHIVHQELPKIIQTHNAQNIYYQTRSTLLGLESVMTPLVVKTRTDEFYSNLNKFVEELDPSKLVYGNIFVRDVSYKRYHISDHLFGGTTVKLLQTFQRLREVLEDTSKVPYPIWTDRTPAEAKIGLLYLLNSNYEIDLLLNCPETRAFEIMKNEFKIINVENFSPYLIRSSAAGEITSLKDFLKRDTVLNLLNIKTIEDCAPRGPILHFADRIQFKMRKFLRTP